MTKETVRAVDAFCRVQVHDHTLANLEPGDNRIAWFIKRRDADIKTLRAALRRASVEDFVRGRCSPGRNEDGSLCTGYELPRAQIPAAAKVRYWQAMIARAAEDDAI